MNEPGVALHNDSTPSPTLKLRESAHITWLPTASLITSVAAASDVCTVTMSALVLHIVAVC
jgi:hypothetical protein